MNNDDYGAYVPGPGVRVPGKPGGPLAGVSFAVKDLFDVAGQRTGAGNPDWLMSHPPAAKHAWAVQALLEAGAELVGRTITVEMAFGMEGDNAHYGMPVNPAAPDRVPGGSSCGSAVAVAAGLCDAALGSDTGGSVRVPASYCGIFGMRPSHGRIPAGGLVPLSPSFDTVGFFAASGEMLERIGRALLPPAVVPTPFRRLLWAKDIEALTDPDVLDAVLPLARRAEALLGPIERVHVGGASLPEWAADYRTLMAREAWSAHGEWIMRARPRFGPEVARRFEGASKVTAAQAAAAQHRREAIAHHVRALLADGAVLCLPTTPSAAPRRGKIDAYEQARLRAHLSTCIAGLARLPQVTIPAGRAEEAPVGLSLVGGEGSDLALLRLAARLAPAAE
jgi:amidase